MKEYKIAEEESIVHDGIISYMVNKTNETRKCKMCQYHDKIHGIPIYDQEIISTIFSGYDTVAIDDPNTFTIEMHQLFAWLFDLDCPDYTGWADIERILNYAVDSDCVINDMIQIAVHYLMRAKFILNYIDKDYLNRFMFALVASNCESGHISLGTLTNMMWYIDQESFEIDSYTFQCIKKICKSVYCQKGKHFPRIVVDIAKKEGFVDVVSEIFDVVKKNASEGQMQELRTYMRQYIPYDHKPTPEYINVLGSLHDFISQIINDLTASGSVTHEKDVVNDILLWYVSRPDDFPEKISLKSLAKMTGSTDVAQLIDYFEPEANQRSDLDE